MVDKPIVAIVAPNPYLVTNLTMHLEGRVKADFMSAYNLDDAERIFKENNITIGVIYSSIFLDEKVDLKKFGSCKKIIIISPIDEFAKMNLDMKKIIEVFEKPVNVVALENTLRKNI